MKKYLLTLITCLLTYLLQGQQDINVNFNHDGKTVYGTFKVPAGTRKFKTIIICAGSGPNDRYGTFHMTGGNVACLYPALLNDTLRYYDELSDALQAAGYAVLIYDKLEFTYGGSLGTITFHKLWLPVESAINYLKTRNDVDTNNIILIGHSEGSAINPYIAKNRKDVKALISVAGARTPFDSMLAYQIVYIAQTCGGNVQQAQAQADQILAYFNIVRTHTWDGTTPALFGVPPSVWYDYVTALDPVPANYNSCALPTLFLGLEKDINVPPPELARLKKEVGITNDFWSIPSLIHYMTPDNDPHIAKVVPDTIIHWLRTNGFHSGTDPVSAIEMSVRVLPNPAVSELTVSIDEPVENITVTILDINGRKVATEIFTGHDGPFQETFDTSGIQAGIYFLQIEVEGRTIARKLVKQ